MTPRTHRPARAALAALTAVLALTGCTQAQLPWTQTSPTTSQQAAARAGDVAFAQLMIAHQRQAIELADLALAKTGISDMIPGFANTIKSTQGPQIQLMTGWLSSWGAAPTPPASAANPGLVTAADLQSLRAASGTDFSRRWAAAMITHDEGAVTLANQVLTTTTDPAVKSLAYAIVAAQNTEIVALKALLVSL